MTRGPAVTGLLVAIAAIIGALVYQSAPSSVRSVGDLLHGGRAVPDDGGLPNGVIEHGCPAVYPDPAHDPRMRP